MKFSLSGRCVVSGDGLLKENEEFLQLAGDLGFDGVDLRWDQMNPDLPRAKVEEAKDLCAKHGLAVAALNTKAIEPADLGPMLELAKELGCGRIRAGGAEDAIQAAADLAAPYGIRLATQMHTNGAYETVAAAKETLARIDRPNFGVIIEPANLYMAGDELTADNFSQIADSIFWCHVQSLIVAPPDETPTKLTLRSGKQVGYKRVPIRENTGCDMPGFFAALKGAGFDDYVNCLEPTPDTDDWAAFFGDYLAYLKEVAG